MIYAFTLLHFNSIRCQGNACGIKWVAGIHLGRRIHLGFLKIGFYFEMMYIVGIINKVSQEKSPSTRTGQPQAKLLTGQVKHRLLVHLAHSCARRYRYDNRTAASHSREKPTGAMAGRPAISHGESCIKGGISAETSLSDGDATHQAHVDWAGVCGGWNAAR